MWPWFWWRSWSCGSGVESPRGAGEDRRWAFTGCDRGEALIGAMIVLAEWVAEGRVFGPGRGGPAPSREHPVPTRRAVTYGFLALRRRRLSIDPIRRYGVGWCSGVGHRPAGCHRRRDSRHADTLFPKAGSSQADPEAPISSPTFASSIRFWQCSPLLSDGGPRGVWGLRDRGGRPGPASVGRG